MAQGLIQSLIQFIRICVRCCNQCEKRFLIAVIILFGLNTYFFILFTYYFTDAPDFTSITVPQNQHLRKSPYADNYDQSWQASVTPPDKDQVFELPCFSYDQSEFIMSATIERQGGHMDNLYVTVFALNRLLLSKGRSDWGPNRVSKKAKDLWHAAELKMKRIYYYANGTRDRMSGMECRIANVVGGDAYLVPAVFMPTSLSIDDNFNNKLDIMRCQMHYIIPELSMSNQSVQVELLRRHRNGSASPLLKFNIPWGTRRTGYMHHRVGVPTQALFKPPTPSIPDDEDARRKHTMHHSTPVDVELLYFSKWDSWENFHVTPEVKHDKLQTRIYLCVCGKTSSPILDDIALLLEFIQHHLLLGVNHIFLSVRYAWDSHNMHVLLLSLRHFIDSEVISVMSQAMDGYDRTASTSGMAWGNDFLKLYHCTSVLYLAKGITNSEPIYLGAWDLDTFFIPKGFTDSMWSWVHQFTAKNFAHFQNSPSFRRCYFLLPHRKLQLIRSFKRDEVTYPWIGHKFAADFRFLDFANYTWYGDFNAILDVELSFQFGIPASNCQQVLLLDAQHSHSSVLSSKYDYFIEAKELAYSENTSVLYSFLSKKVDVSQRDDYHVSKTQHKNAYVSRYFERVLNSLKAANLDLIVSLNLPEEPARIGTAVEHWPPYKTVDQDSLLAL